MMEASRPWGAALAALLAALGADAADAGKGPKDLDAALRGQGLSGTLMRLNGAGIPEAAGGGVLVEMADGGWVPLIDAGDGGFRTPEGEAVADLAGWAVSGRAALIRAAGAGVARPLGFLRRYKGRAAEIMFGGLMINLFSLCFPLFGAFVYDKVLNNGITETLWALAIGLLLLIGLDYSIRGVRAHLVERFAAAAEADIDRSVFDKVLSGTLTALPSVGRVLDQYKQILGSRDFLSASAMLAAVDVPFLVLFLITVAWIGGFLVLVPLVLGSVLIGVHALAAVPTLEAEAEARRAGEARFTLLADALTSREAVVGGRFADALRLSWRRASLRAGAASGRSRFWHALAYAASADFSNLSYVSVIVTGAYMIEARELTTGRLLACSILTSRAIASLASVVTLIIRYRELARALSDLDATLPSPPPAAAAKPRGRLAGEVRLSGVSCRLRAGGPPALDGVDLLVRPGEFLGIAGRPGAGKTTLLRLVAGALRPDAGEALLDNVPVAALAPHDLSLNVGYKPQDLCLFEASLEDNLRLGQGEVTRAALDSAIRRAGLMPAIARGEINLTTSLGPRGSALSGGQRQMVALARAFVGEPSVLLLDEPTTGLDAPAEQHLAEVLKARPPGTTLLVSTHSRALLSICDRILVLDGGRVAALGPRDKVLVS
ncbi:peptidase domain-containing ABC transporter [Oleispirillum naphthae]|uniref:peptidase domain-containing ABC transporter n=1 Tax=Oleispirillum naphthae TaxID=2838853 RepID=UPI003082507B